MAEELRARGADRRWPLLVHGEDGRDALLARFREAGRALLLGTASFWEGVDVPGDALRGLVLAKLPFRVPSEPVRQRSARRSRRAAATASASSCCRTRRSASSRGSVASCAPPPTGA
jgi:ATP-dependent DNA helicase DinG